MGVRPASIAIHDPPALAGVSARALILTTPIITTTLIAREPIGTG